MSLPPLTTAGASYAGAWRAQDAVRNGSQQVSSVPAHIAAGGDLITRYTNGSTWFDAASANSTYSATGLDGLPAIVNEGVAGQYSTDAGLLSVAEGSGKKFMFFIRGSWAAAEGYNMGCGFEAWIENQCAYLENGGFWRIQMDRGSGRRGFGDQEWSGGVYSWMIAGDTSGNFDGRPGDAPSPEATMSFDGAVSEWSAFAIGPVQRTAAGAAPPGIWTYTVPWTWGRCVVVACGASFLNEADRDNLIAWVEGQNFAAESSPFFFGMAP